jgi:hypothetical protein
MTIYPTNTVELAKKGDLKAISELLNDQLQLRNVAVKVSVKDNCFLIMLISTETPQQLESVEFIRQAYINLHINPWHTVKIYGRRVGEEFPDWYEDIQIESILENLAKQGDIKAISQLIAQHLPSGTVSKVSLQNECLRIMLAAIEMPDELQMSSLIKPIIKSLEVQSIKKLSLYGKQLGADFPDWELEVNLTEAMIKCPRCKQPNYVTKDINSIDCNSCGCFINVFARQDEIIYK